MPEAEQGMNVARIASLRAGIPVSASAATRQSLLLVRTSGHRLRRRTDHVRVQLGDRRRRHRVHEPDSDGRPQGRAEPDADGFVSRRVFEHRASSPRITRASRRSRARSRTRSRCAVINGQWRRWMRDGSPTKSSRHRPTVRKRTTWVRPQGSARDQPEGGVRPQDHPVAFATDEGPRRDASIEALLKLRPAFHVAGSVTAGNSSQMSDGAAAVIVTSAAYARERGLTPLGRFVTFATAGVEPERFGVGPVPAIRKPSSSPA